MRDDLYEQCSDHITEKMPSSVTFGVRPMWRITSLYSLAERPNSSAWLSVASGRWGCCSVRLFVRFDFEFRQVGAERFVEAPDEAIDFVVDEIVEIAVLIGFKHELALVGVDEAQHFLARHVRHGDGGFVFIVVQFERQTARG